MEWRPFVVREDLTPDKRGIRWSMQHHLKGPLLKDGVYERSEAVETFSRTAHGHLESWEGGIVVA
jgi:hypothetical protein